jgi:hypothetical protein
LHARCGNDHAGDARMQDPPTHASPLAGQ